MAKVLNKIDLPEVDTERFRLRSFIEDLTADGEVEVHDAPVDLTDIAAHLEGSEKAVLFRHAGPEGAELVGNVMGSRARLAASFGVAPEELLAEVRRRLAAPQPYIEVPRAAAPVQQVVLEGDDADLTALPVHFQHGMDGGPYISATIDYTVDPDTGLTNVGCRRLMLRNQRETGIDLNSPSDLRTIYEAAVLRGERLPVSFTLGAHPADHVAATMRLPTDELTLAGTLRGAKLPVVRCVTNDLLVPADAEYVLEGYIDEHGYVEHEGPYGEFLGYYGGMKMNPVFHVTAITRRDDALFQTSTIAGRTLGRTDTSQICALRTEATVWRALETAVREPLQVYTSAASGGMFNVRIALRQRVPGEARNAIVASFGSLANVKNVFVVDDDIDVFSDEQMDWALATRFQPDRDLVVESGFRTLPLDPSLDGGRIGSKAGFDLTFPVGSEDRLSRRVPAPPEPGAAKFATVEEALADGPKTFGELIATLGSRDGREIALALDDIRQAGRLTRIDDGVYALRGD